MVVRIGTAGWSIPREHGASCPGEGTHLQRYARVFSAAEINSSFHRPHAARTYEKWSACVPGDFRFAVKLPRVITHDARLRRSREPLAQFLEETSGLGRRRGPLLVQLPPSFEFEIRAIRRFLMQLRDAYRGPVVCEPRHPSWFAARPDDVLREYRVARVAADPAPVPGADEPGGWDGLIYHRLHGSPDKYWSRYSHDRIVTLASRLNDAPPRVERWCIFDNTASGAALANALELKTALSEVPSTHGSRMGKQSRRGAAGRRRAARTQAGEDLA